MLVLLTAVGCKQEHGTKPRAPVQIESRESADFRKELHKKESEKLQRYSQYVSRKGSTLEISLVNGKTLTLTDVHDDGHQAITFEFVDYLGDIDHVLVRQYHYEGGAYTIVDRKYGSKQQIDDIPVFSPDRGNFVTVSICDAYCPYRVQVWQRHDGGGWYQMVWSFRPNEYWASGTGKWLDNATVEITREIADPATNDPSKGQVKWVKKPIYLKLEPIGWIVSEK